MGCVWMRFMRSRTTARSICWMSLAQRLHVLAVDRPVHLILDNEKNEAQ